ncbi:MAG: nucleoside hydrolase [Clostridia bacterium]|nr:nucleoside hydrolase [Clostridia bacterium]
MKVDGLIDKLYAPGVKKMILDTDTFNEEDDQFALSYALLSPDKVDLLSVNAAPFFNGNSTSPEDGMEKSYDEILRILGLVKPAKVPAVYKGSRQFMSSRNEPVESPACDNIINTVLGSDETVYIVTIGAATNVASAILKCPEVAEKAVVIWLGGTAHHIPSAREFNLSGDIFASQVLFDSGVRFVQVPCEGVCTEFVTNLSEMEHFLAGKNDLAEYLLGKMRKVIGYGTGKVIWDVTAVACLVRPDALVMAQVPTPVLTGDHTYAFDNARHHQIYVRKIWRDLLYLDLFNKVASL